MTKTLEITLDEEQIKTLTNSLMIELKVDGVEILIFHCPEGCVVQQTKEEYYTARLECFNGIAH